MKIIKFIKKRYKRIILSVVSLISCFVMLTVPASAVSVNGASIVGVDSRVRINGTTYYVGTSSVINNKDTIQFNYQIPYTLTDLIDTYNAYEFAGENNYGVLTLTISSAFGSPYHSQNVDIANWNGLYNPVTNTKLASASVSGNSFVVRYEGYIPSRIDFRCYFTSNPDDVLQTFITSSIDFAPLKDPNIPSDTEQIINNQNQNADKVTNGWQSNNQPNTDSIGNLNDVENGINQSTQGGRDNVNNTFSNFSITSNSSVGKGMLAFTNIAKEFLGLTGFSEIINFGLVLGLVAFLLGVSATWSGVSRSARQQGYKQGYEQAKQNKGGG